MSISLRIYIVITIVFIILGVGTKIVFDSINQLNTSGRTAAIELRKQNETLSEVIQSAQFFQKSFLKLTLHASLKYQQSRISDQAFIARQSHNKLLDSIAAANDVILLYPDELAAINNQLEKLDQLSKSSFVLVSRRPQVALPLLQGIDRYSKQLLETIVSLKEKNLIRANKDIQLIQDESDKRIAQFYQFASLLFIILFFALYLTIFSIIRPIKRVTNALQSLAGYDVNIEIPNIMHGKNEIAKLWRSTFHLKGALIQKKKDEIIKLKRAKELEQALKREQKLSELLKFSAHNDALTGLLNRQGFDYYLEELHLDENYVYAIIDLNMFKPINDTFGHAAGDAVLKEVGKRLKDVLCDNHICIRNGGDEFSVLVKGDGTREFSKKLGAVLVSIFNEPLHFNDRDIKINAAIGIAQYNDRFSDIDRMLTAADSAMYLMKKSAGTNFKVYNDNIVVKVSDPSQGREIALAIENKEIKPWLQPKYNMITQELIGFEALARWEKSPTEIISPHKFLMNIADHGLQMDFTMLILKSTLEQMKEWKAKGLNFGKISVNISEETLASESGNNEIIKILRQYPDICQYMIFEITENVFLSRISDAVNRAISKIIAEGVEISMDDFGTGYASFRHLNEFIFHEIKIDKSFVHGIGKDKSSEIILSGFMYIAKGLGARVIAEGIETQEQQDFLISIGCEFAQGFYYGKAQNFEQTELILFDNVELSQKIA